MSINLEEIKRLVKARYIGVQKHPEADLFIYNYTQRCQYDRVWTEETMTCRGLILDSAGKIVARPFKKFFNLGEPYGEATVLPPVGVPFKVYDKVDGSLGILYWLNGVPRIATRGSFTSDQAIEGTKMLQEIMAGKFGMFNPELTYLFEIIYPGNRVVVDYKGMRDLVYLGAIETATGRDVPVTVPMNGVTTYHGLDDYRYLKNLQTDNAEGFVIHWENGLRLKVKFDEYLRLHRIITGTSARTIWEYLAIEDVRKYATNKKMLGLRLKLDEEYVGRFLSLPDDMVETLLDRVPDEFHKWAKSVIFDLREQYAEIDRLAKRVFERENFKNLERGKAARRIAAAYKDLGQILFLMLDGREYTHAIWNMIYPPHEIPFKEDAG